MIIPYNRHQSTMHVCRQIEHASCNKIALYLYLMKLSQKKQQVLVCFAFHFNAQNSHKTTIETAPF